MPSARLCAFIQRSLELDQDPRLLRNELDARSQFSGYRLRLLFFGGTSRSRTPGPPCWSAEMKTMPAVSSVS